MVLENYHLLEVIDIIQNVDDEIPDFYIDWLRKELFFSSLVLPRAGDNAFQLMCSESRTDELFIPAFTSFEKYYDFFGHDSFKPSEIEFEDLIYSINDSVIGLMINPTTDHFFIPLDFLMDLDNIEFPSYDGDFASKGEFKKFLKKVDNGDLFNNFKSDEFNIDNPDFNSKDFINLLKEFKNTVFFSMITTDVPIKGKSKNNIYKKNTIKNLGYYLIGHNHGRLLLFSSEKLALKEHSHKKYPQDMFLDVVSFTDAVKIVLKADFGGIIINHSTKPIFLNRILLIDYLDEIIDYAHNPDVGKYYPFCKLI